MHRPALLALADGTLFRGKTIGSEGSASGEVVFNTAMTGYQEILTDPSYCKQIITLTYPHIGNTGINPNDSESTTVHAAGLVIRDLPFAHSSWRATQSLDTYLIEQNVVAIAEIDTRRLTRILRESGAQNGCIMAGEVDDKQALEQARAFPGLKGMDLAKFVSTAAPYEWSEGTWRLDCNDFTTSSESQFHVVAYDFGVKRNILRILVDLGCKVTVVPATTTAESALKLNPDGIFLSNGPGDPEPCDYAIQATRRFLEEKIPVFGICLGHQILGLAAGAKTVKMKFGHHGANHPVIDLESREVMISSQNHGFAVDESSLPADVRATHRSLFDQSLQGLALTDCPAFGFQGHPEASPGPHDVASLFKQFINMLAASRSSSKRVSA
ncbi:MAG: glutamine-hydrolyzing carbamoyl-phosphate synthase small subunit [Gammaproteobacteria bacterium]